MIAVILILVVLGIVMLASASTVRGDVLHGDSGFFVKRQLLWLVVAVVAAALAARLDYHIYSRLAVAVAVVSVLLLLLVWSPIGLYINGSYRWLRLGPLTVQPSEFSKPAVIMLFAWWLARNQRRIDELKRGILVPFALLGCFVVPIIAEPDFGTTMLMSSVCIFMMFLGGVLVAPLLVSGCLGMIVIVVLLFQNPERMSRITAFMDPEKHQLDKAWQLANSLRAFAGGGWRGVGPGNSMQKYHYLPEAHTDFIFPIIGEELGLVAAIAVLLLFVLLFLCGLGIAMRARDDFGRFMAFGITLMITMQALINFCVVTGCVPTKGLALPFISYGGSSLVVSGLMIGILINVALTNMRSPSAADRNLFKDRARSV